MESGQQHRGPQWKPGLGQTDGAPSTVPMVPVLDLHPAQPQCSRSQLLRFLLTPSAILGATKAGSAGAAIIHSQPCGCNAPPSPHKAPGAEPGPPTPLHPPDRGLHSSSDGPATEDLKEGAQISASFFSEALSCPCANVPPAFPLISLLTKGIRRCWLLNKAEKAHNALLLPEPWPAYLIFTQPKALTWLTEQRFAAASKQRRPAFPLTNINQ